MVASTWDSSCLLPLLPTPHLLPLAFSLSSRDRPVTAPPKEFGTGVREEEQGEHEERQPLAGLPPPLHQPPVAVAAVAPADCCPWLSWPWTAALATARLRPWLLAGAGAATAVAGAGPGPGSGLGLDRAYSHSRTLRGVRGAHTAHTGTYGLCTV